MLTRPKTPFLRRGFVADVLSFTLPSGSLGGSTAKPTTQQIGLAVGASGYLLAIVTSDPLEPPPPILR